MFNKTVAIIVVLIMVMVVSGCSSNNNNNNSDISKIRVSDKSSDIIKFDDIEWLQESKLVERKALDIITIDGKEYEVKEDEEDLTQLPIGMKNIVVGISDYKGTVGKLAGWNIESIYFNYITTDKDLDNRYLYEVFIVIEEKDKGTEEIYNDIYDKISKKYGDNVENLGEHKISNYIKEIRWIDGNENFIQMELNSDKIYMWYYCGDVLKFMNQYREDVEKNGVPEDNRGL